MPMDGFALRYLVGELQETLAGARVDKITQPEPDEIVMSLRCPGVTRQLLLTANANAPRAHLTARKRPNPLEPPAFCMLMRRRLAGARVESVSQYMRDRVLDIRFSATDDLGDPCLLTLTCEFMGRHSNLILYDQNLRILESVRRVPADMSSVRQVLPGLYYERPPVQDKLWKFPEELPELRRRLENSGGLWRKALAKHVMGLSEQTAEEIARAVTGDGDGMLVSTDPSMAQKCEAVGAWLADAGSRVAPVVIYDAQGIPADVCVFPYACREHMAHRAFSSISEAMDEYSAVKDDLMRVQQKATALRHTIKRNIERCEKKLALRLQTIKDSERMDEYRIKGELLTAAIAQIPKGAKRVELTNWYDENGAIIEIALDETISPARNAQKYFKLYQKARNAASLAKQQADETREELQYLEGQLENLEKSAEEADLQEIREELQRLDYVRAGNTRKQMKALPPSKPLRFRSRSGREILVGKNNVQNERLTFSSDPDDFWLHAKDMPGSHVIVRGPDPDDESLYDAAMLAALYSKGAESSNVPVDATARRYVKKPGGTKPGYVTYTHQTTLYVTPSREYAKTLASEEDR